jgi:dihydroflavonol-4-reductase
VTGASGYLGSEIVYQLLESGQTVHATCRSLPPHLQTWKRTYGERLKLFSGIDLASESIDQLGAVLQGCDFAIHTAAPFPSTCVGIDVAGPTLASMHNVLAACRLNSVRRAVVTSSMAACRGPRDTPHSGGVFNEDDWNLSSRPDGPGMEPYQRAKTDAELAARALAVAGGPEVVALLPTCLLGPIRGGPAACAGATSVRMFRAWLGVDGDAGDGGGRGARVQSRLVCDVRDAAAAHIFAAAELDSDVIGPTRFRSDKGARLQAA